MSVPYRLLAALGLSLTLSLPASAQNAPADTVAFETDADREVVVTASRLPEDARSTGRHVTVLTGAEIAALPVASLDEALRFAGGVDVQPRGGFGVQADYRLRGAPFNGVLLLVDGARFNDPMTGHFLSDFPVPLGQIARVEVLHGPAAAVYGPDALGGVIHVVTHTGASSGTARAARSRLDLRYGERATALGALSTHGTTAGGTAYDAGAEGGRSDGEAFRGEDGQPVVSSDGPVRTDFERLAGSAGASFPVGRARGYFRVAGDVRDFGATQFYTPFASDTAREATQTLWAQARLAGPAGSARWRAQVSGRVHRDEYAFFPGLDPNEHTSRRLGALADLALPLRSDLTLSLGFSAEHRSITSNALGEHADLAGGVFALARYRPAPALTVTASGRLDADAVYGVEATPMLAAAFSAARGLTLRAAAGRAIRAPNYVERYFNTVSPRPSGNLGNPDLRAERAWNAEAGADLDLAPGLALRATGFYRRTDDLIDYAQLDPADEFFLAQNVLAATAAGLETGLRLRRSLGDARLALDLAYTYTDVSLSDERPGAVYKYALSHAPHLVQLAAAAQVGYVRLGLQSLVKDRLGDLETVALVHGRVSVLAPRMWLAGRAAAEVFAEVRNLTDADYAEVFGAPMPRRRVLAGLRVGFGG
ncbi:MAG: TonB-dependent receptor [Bacteroidota bacterium]